MRSVWPKWLRSWSRTHILAHGFKSDLCHVKTCIAELGSDISKRIVHFYLFIITDNDTRNLFMIINNLLNIEVLPVVNVHLLYVSSL